MFKGFCQALDVPEWAEDPLYANYVDRIKHREELTARMNEVTVQRPTVELVEKLNEAGVPCGPIYSMNQAFEDPQVKHLKMVKPAHHAKLGNLNLLRSPINLSAFPHSDQFDRAGPDLGEHTDEILREFGYADDELRDLRERGAI